MNRILIALLEVEPRKSLLRSAFGLWAITTVLGVLLLLLVAMAIMNRRARREAAGTSDRKRRRPIADAWAEAGRRAEPIRMDEPEPPTTDEPEEERP